MEPEESTVDPTIPPPASEHADAKLDRLARLALWQTNRSHADQSLADRDSALNSLVLNLDDPDQRDFGEYELISLLGKGGMGVVYLAKQRSLDRDVAIKLLIDGMWSAPEFIERLRREAHSAARMQHPNIVEVYDTGEFEGLHFVSMRLVRGGNLQESIRATGPMSAKAAAELIQTLAEAVNYAHQLGILHLDLKPANILLDQGGRPQVADFGLAQRLSDLSVGEDQGISGTPSYMAPEQVRVAQDPLSIRTDVYGLGAILYECLTGRPPQLGKSAQETMEHVVANPPVRPRSLQKSVPADLEAICLKCLQKNAADRYATAAALADDLRRYREGHAVEATPLAWTARLSQLMKRHSVSISGVAVAALMPIFLLGAWTSWRISEDRLRYTEVVSASLIRKALVEEGKVNLNALGRWASNGPEYAPRPEPSMAGYLDLQRDAKHITAWILTTLSRDLTQVDASPVAERVVGRMLYRLSEQERDELMKHSDHADLAAWAQFEEQTSPSAPPDFRTWVQKFFESSMPMPKDEVEAVTMYKVCSYLKILAPACARAESLVSTSGRTIEHLRHRSRVREAEETAKLLRSARPWSQFMSEADIRDLSDSYYLGFVGQSGFDGEPFETLESRSKFLSCMSDDDEVANAINPETCLPLLKGAIESTSDPVMVLRVTRAASERWGEELVREQFPLSLEEAESQFRATRAVLFWCVPPSEAARVWDRMAKEAALEFMPAIVEENASCPIDSLYAALSRNR